MSVFMTLRIALKALARNKMRTVLTMLGMIIGVAAVITMVALGAGAQAAIADQIKGAGTNTVTIFPGSANQGGVQTGAGGSSRLTPADAEALFSTIGQVDLLLTDVMMPGISGIQLAEIVRAERPELKIVCMSRYPGAVDHDLLKAGLSYLPKPFTTEALATIVAGALAR